MDPLTIALLALVITGAAYAITKIILITAKWLKERIKKRLREKGSGLVTTLKGKKLKELLRTASEEAATMDPDVLDQIADDELIIATVMKDGDVKDVERVQGDKGMEKNLSDLLSSNDDIITFTA